MKYKYLGVLLLSILISAFAAAGVTLADGEAAEVVCGAECALAAAPEEAFIKANEAGLPATVTLLSDWTVSGTAEAWPSEGAYFLNNNAYGITIDLNGHTINVTNGCFLRTAVPLTITDSSEAGTGLITTADLTGGKNGFIFVDGGVTLSVLSGTIRADLANPLIYIGGSDMASLNMQGGALINAGEGPAVFAAHDGITNYISGGTVDGSIEKLAAGSADTQILAGKFTFNPEGIEGITLTHPAYDNGDGTFAVGAACVNGMGFSDINAAAKEAARLTADAQPALPASPVQAETPETPETAARPVIAAPQATIKMLDDVTVMTRADISLMSDASDDMIPRVVELDLNGRRIYVKSQDGAIGINGNGTLIVTDSSEKQTGVFTAEDDVNYCLYASTESSKINICGGSFIGGRSLFMGYAAPKIYGGWFCKRVISEYLPDGFSATGECEVSPYKPAMYTVGAPICMVSTEYNDILCANMKDAVEQVAFAGDDAFTSIILLTDCAIDKPIDITGGYTLTDETTSRAVNIDLNGFELLATAPMDYMIGVNDGDLLYVLDSSEEKTGMLTGCEGVGAFVYLPTSACYASFNDAMFTGAEKLSDGEGFLQVSSGKYQLNPLDNMSYFNWVTKLMDLYVADSTVENAFVQVSAGDTRISLRLVLYFTDEIPTVQYQIGGTEYVAECQITGFSDGIFRGVYDFEPIPLYAIADDLRLCVIGPDYSITKVYSYSVLDYLNEIPYNTHLGEDANQYISQAADIVYRGWQMQQRTGKGTEFTPDAWTLLYRTKK